MKPSHWLAVPLVLQGFASSFAAENTAPTEASHAPVTIDLNGCEDALETEVRRIVAVELKAATADGMRAQEHATRVVATCGDTTVDLSLTDAATTQSLEQRVEISEAGPEGRARLLALAVAELVVASWNEIEGAPLAIEQPASPPPPPPAAPLPPAEPPSPMRSAMVDVVAAGRVFPESGLWLVGFGARGALLRSRPFVLGIEVTAEWGTATRSTGQVGARVVGGALSLAWTVERRWALMMPWLGVRGGMARLEGEPSPSSTSTSGETQSGPFLGPEIGAMAVLFPRRALHATVGLSAGAALLGVQGEVVGDRNVSVLGPWAALVIGVGLSK